MDSLSIDRELMPQGQVFQAQRGPRPEEACHEGQQSLDDGKHDQRPQHHGVSENSKSPLIQHEEANEKSQMDEELRVFGRTQSEQLQNFFVDTQSFYMIHK